MKKGLTKTRLILIALVLSLACIVTGIFMMSNTSSVKADDPIDMGYGYRYTGALNINWGDNIDLYLCTQNGPGTTDWVVFKADSNDSMTLTRNGITYNVGNTSESIVWRNGYWRIETWKFASVSDTTYPVKNGDIVSLNGTFTSTDGSIHIQFSGINIIYYCNGDKPTTSTVKYVNVVNEGTVDAGYGYSRSECANYNTSAGKITGFYFKMEKNDNIPYDSGWAVEYKPRSAASIQLLRDETLYNVAKVDQGTFVKFSDTEYYFKLEAWTFDKLPILAGDEIIIEGEFYYTDSVSITTVINISRTIIQVSSTPETVSAETKAWVYGDTVTATTSFYGKTTYKDWAGASYYYFGVNTSSLPTNLTPLTPDAVKLTRGDNTYNVGAYWASDALMSNGGDSYLIKKEYFNNFVSGLGTTQEGDIITLEGKFVGIIDNELVYVEILKTEILASKNTSQSSGYFYSACLPTHYGTVESMDRNSESFHTQMNVVISKMDDDNNVPAGSWDYTYKPTSSSNIIYNEGTVGATDQAVAKISLEAFDALSTTTFVFRIDQQGISSNAPLGAKLVFNGYFVYSGTVDGYATGETAGIYIDNLTFYKVGSNAYDWAQKYELSYELNGGTVETTNPTVYNTIYGATITAPTKENAVFAGWYNQGLTEKIETLIGKTGDIKLYATYTKVFDFYELSLGGSFTLKYYIVASGLETVPQVTFSMEGITDDVEEGTLEGDYYVYSFSKISAKSLANEITAKVNYLGQDVTLVRSVEDYLIALSQTSISDAKKTLIGDIVAYGQAAGSSIEDIEGCTASTYTTPDHDYSRTETTLDGAKFTSAKLKYTNRNNIIVTFTVPVANTNFYVTVNDVNLGYTTVSEGTYQVKTSDIYANQFDNVYTFKLYVDGTCVQTLTYSVRSYVVQINGTAESTDKLLTQRLYCYGESVKNCLN